MLKYNVEFYQIVFIAIAEFAKSAAAVTVIDDFYFITTAAAWLIHYAVNNLLLNYY